MEKTLCVVTTLLRSPKSTKVIAGMISVACAALQTSKRGPIVMKFSM